MTTLISENAVAPHGKIVRRLDNFPELMRALRGGDLLTGRLLCAQVFNFQPRARFDFSSASDQKANNEGEKTHQSWRWCDAE